MATVTNALPTLDRLDTAPLDALRLSDSEHDKPVNRVMRVLERWHNETHPGGFDLCREQPCYAAQRAVYLA